MASTRVWLPQDGRVCVLSNGDLIPHSWPTYMGNMMIIHGLIGCLPNFHVQNPSKPNFPCMPWLRPLLSRSCALTLIWLPTLQKSRPSKRKLSFWSRKIASASWSPFVEARYWQGRESPITWNFTDNYLPSPSPPVFWKQFCCGSIPPWDIVARSSQSASSASSASSDLLFTSYLPIPHTPLFYHTFLLLPLPS